MRHVLSRKLFRGALGLALLIAVTAVWFVPAASAHNSLIRASMDCGGVVSFTATAWAGPTAASRTNSDVRVSSSSDNGRTWVQVASGHFDQADGFSFSGTYSAGTSTAVRLKVQEIANWGDGARPAGPGFTSATRPTNCATTTTTTTTTTTATTPTTTTPTTTTTTATTPTTPTTPTTATTPTTTIPSTPPPVTTPVPAPAPGLSLAKVERAGTSGSFGRGPVPAAVGEVVFYEMLAVNTGNTTLEVTLADPRCDAGTVAPLGAVTLSPGASVTFTCSHVVKRGDGPRFVNTATVTAGGVTATSSVVANVATVATGAGVLGTAHAKKVVKQSQPAHAVVKIASFTG